MKYKVGLVNINKDILENNEDNVMEFKVESEFKDLSDFIKNYNHVSQSTNLLLDYVIVFLDEKGCSDYSLEDAIKEITCLVDSNKLLLFTNKEEYYQLPTELKFKINKLERVMKFRKIKEVIIG